MPCAPDEPELKETVRAVADFLAATEDPAGGWRYPHPRSSAVIMSQGWSTPGKSRRRRGRWARNRSGWTPSRRRCAPASWAGSAPGRSSAGWRAGRSAPARSKTEWSSTTSTRNRATASPPRLHAKAARLRPRAAGRHRLFRGGARLLPAAPAGGAAAGGAEAGRAAGPDPGARTARHEANEPSFDPSIAGACNRLSALPALPRWNHFRIARRAGQAAGLLREAGVAHGLPAVLAARRGTATSRPGGRRPGPE